MALRESARRWGWAAGLVLSWLGAIALPAEQDLPPVRAGAEASRPPMSPAADADLPPLPPTINGDSAEPAPTGPRPPFLGRPLDTPPPVPAPFPQPETLFRTPVDPPTGYTGPSSVLPREGQQSAHFVPVEDRWRIGFPDWDRYGKVHPFDDDYPFDPGRKWDPFHQNVIKGDYPIIGQNTFLEVTGLANTFVEPRMLPTQTTPFESTARPFEENFFGRFGSLLALQFVSLSFDLFHGDAAFKPVDWRIRLTPTFNVNNLALNERAQVDPNVLSGVERLRTWWALQEAFVEVKFADLSPDYDFVSARAGTQPFISDFRGFLFADINRGVRIFGSKEASRDQYNLVYFRQWEKDTNSGLNTFNDRRQNLLFANYYRQDFIWPGYTTQFSLNFNNDPKSLKFDKNHFLVRPDPVGVFRPHDINVGYFGWAGDGHIGRYNLTHQFYWAFGRDSMNPLANRSQTINAQMFAVEGSYDRDWARFRVSLFWSSGDHNINNSHATGFDTILDAPNFAGGPFSFFNRQQIPLFGVNLVHDLRSSKIQGQANFVNPGLFLINVGADFDLTPKIKMFNNCNFLWFDQTNVLEQFLYDGHIDKNIGVDLSTGFEYKPLLSENISIISGISMLIPGQGFRNIYNNFSSRVDPLVAAFMNVNLAF
jgi:hypothetical protein